MKKIFIYLLLLFSSFVHASDKIEMIPLQHRLATEILPHVESLLPQGSTIRAANNMLIIKASADAIDSIRPIIKQLDIPIKRVQITVLMTSDKLSRQQQISGNANIEINSDGIHGTAGIHSWSNNDAKNQDRLYKAQGIEGQPVQILMQQLKPQHDYYLFSGDTQGVVTTTYYLDITNGFSALARLLSQSQAVIEIQPVFGDQRYQDTEHSSASTTITGAVGEWLELGQINQNYHIANDANVTEYHSRQEQQLTIYIKLDLI